jgi:hypothetical protein
VNLIDGDAGSRRGIKGNDKADQYATNWAMLHCITGTAEAACISAEAWATKVARELGAALAIWPITIELFGYQDGRRKICQLFGNKCKETRVWYDGRRRCKE